jgi:hypothetical protein
MAAIRRRMRTPILIDGRNIYDPDELHGLGFQYIGMGRGVGSSGAGANGADDRLLGQQGDAAAGADLATVATDHLDEHPNSGPGR